VRAGDTVARLGGDEFALILEDAAQLPLLLERCQQLCDTLALPYPLPGPAGEVVARVSASIGIALWNSGTPSDEALIQAADRALYEAKRAGKNRCLLDVAHAA